MRKLKGQRGLSLVEVTIILLVLMLLTGVLAPSIFDFVIDAQWVKVKEDCEVIGISVARFVRDNGRCFRFNGQLRDCSQANTVPLLVGDGIRATTSGTATTAFTDNANTLAANNWNNAATFFDTLANHLILNTPLGGGNLYHTVSQLGFFNIVGPQFNLGWRGAYLAPPIGPDPWGSQYMVNTLFLSPASDPGNTALEGGSGWDRDVFCISPGPNRLVETFFGGELPNIDGAATTPMGTDRRGDDFVFVIQGSTR